MRMTPTAKKESNFDAFVKLVARLRAADGCPWDRAQTHESLKAALLEEAWEVIAAIEQGDHSGLQEELGDLLLHVVLHAQIASEEHTFDLKDVIDGVADKLVRRHPHVFGDEKADTPEQVKATWDRVKRQEKKEEQTHVAGLPALIAALKVQHQLRNKGVYPQQTVNPDDLKSLGKGANPEAAIGDLLYAVVELANQAGVDPEMALQKKLSGVLTHG